jgi:uncharacterized protein (DUF169 family)
MPTTLFDALGLAHRPLAIILSDTCPDDALRFKEHAWGCVGAMMVTATRGRTVAFDRQTFGCPGGGVGLGFGDTYEGFPIECLLSTGGKHRTGAGHEVDFGEGERFVDSPATARRWIDDLPLRQVPTEFVVLRPVDALAPGDEPALAWMLVNPDQLSALTFMAGFRRGAVENVTAPWGAACQSILFALAEAEREHPRGVIGFFDLSQRHRVDRELLSFTMPWPMLEEMAGAVDESFLRSEVWEKLRGRW